MNTILSEFSAIWLVYCALKRNLWHSPFYRRKQQQQQQQQPDTRINLLLFFAACCICICRCCCNFDKFAFVSYVHSFIQILWFCETILGPKKSDCSISMWLFCILFEGFYHALQSHRIASLSLLCRFKCAQNSFGKKALLSIALGWSLHSTTTIRVHSIG